MKQVKNQGVDVVIEPKQHSAYHPTKSRKPQAIKNAVIVKRVNGQSKSSIARDLGIAVNTVNGIIEQSDIEKQLQDGLSQCANLISKSVKVIDQRLDKGSESAAFGILNPLVLSRAAQANPQRMTADVHLQQAINVLIQPNSTQVIDATTVKPASEDPNLT